MPRFKFPKNIKESFRFRIFVTAALFILLISFSFTFFFIRYQHESLTNELIDKGYVFSKLLANSSRLGVVAENGEILEDAAEELLRQEEVLAVSVFTIQGKTLTTKELSPGKGNRGAEKEDISAMIKRMKQARDPLYVDRGDTVDFWAPVVSKSAYSYEKAMFFESGTFSKERTIGFVNIVLDATILHAKVRTLLAKGVVAGIFFLLVGSFIAFLVTGSVTRPLNRLTAAVRALESGGLEEKVPVETIDEVGRLARSFNDMVAALKKRDVEKLYLEAQLRQSQKMEAVGQLAGGVAHEINNPINSIINLAQLIIDEGGKDRSSGRAYAERIITEGGRISNIVKSLLAFSRASVDEKRRINVMDLVSDTLGLIGAQLKKDGIKLAIDAPHDPLEINANPHQIEQVFLNLISNARYALNRKYPAKHEDKILKIVFEKAEGVDDGSVRIAFHDHGTGIPADLIEKVFNPFFTTKPPGSGTGLGLSISYGIIHEHGGTFEISSIEGQSTTAVICLPAAGSPA